MTAEESAVLSQLVPAAIASMKASGVPASITIAQAILESGWLKSSLTIKANNCFGIKAETLTDPGTYMAFPTHEYENGQLVLVEADFEKYETLADCFLDHAMLLSESARYAPAMAVKNDPEEFAEELQDCGYSTSPVYATTLMKLVNEFDLTQYDVEG